MSKEYLEALGKNIRYKKEYIGAGLYRVYIKRNDIELLEQALQSLEAIDNIKPSVALEELNKMGFCRSIDTYVPEIDRDISETQYLENTTEFDIIKQALIKAQEQEKENAKLKGQVNYLTEVVTGHQKILKIIKEKQVSIFWLKECKSVEEYNSVYGKKLTQEEFELLKERLG